MSKKSQLPPKVTKDQVYPIRMVVKEYLQGTTPDSCTKVYKTDVTYIHPERDMK